jgi:hypothetical protein
MQLLAKLTKALGHEPGIVHRLAHWSTRRNSAEPADALKRELYGMGVREQAVVKQVIAMTGQAVTIRKDTVAFGKKGRPCYLEQGSQVTISENPLRIDAETGVQVVVVDPGGKPLSIRMSDYIRDVYAGARG